MNTVTGGIRQRCEEMIRPLVIPRPFDIKVFLSALAHRRRKHIELVSTQLEGEQPCGMLVSTSEADYIYIASSVTPLHAQHIAVHEAGHLAFGHQRTRSHHPGQPSAHDRAEVLGQLLPHLAPALVQRILGRTPAVYDDEQEREAEMFASLVMAEAHHPGSIPPCNPPCSGCLYRLQSAFGIAQQPLPAGRVPHA